MTFLPASLFAVFHLPTVFDPASCVIFKNTDRFMTCFCLQTLEKLLSALELKTKVLSMD